MSTSQRMFFVGATAILVTSLAGLAITGSAQAQSAYSYTQPHSSYTRQYLSSQYSYAQPRYPMAAIDRVAPAEPMIEEKPADSTLVPPELRRTMVNYSGKEAPGTIIIDTPNTYLYYALGNGKAIRYGIGVGRDGYRWSGTKSVVRKQEWPDWHPPAEMIARQPYLPRFVAGGKTNPLGARAIYIGGTLYRIHGTNAPQTIGKQVSSGCIRMLNEDVIDLYSRVSVGAKVVVLPDNGRRKVAVSEIPESQSLAAGAPLRLHSAIY